MKRNPFNLVWKTLILSILVLGSTSCSKDNDNDDPNVEVNNELTYKGQTYDLNIGAFNDYGFEDGYSNIEFSIFHLVSESDPIIPVFLYLDLYSTNQDIESGTYRFSDGETDVDGNTFSDSYLVRNYYWKEDKGDEVATIAGGTVKLSRDGENFKFEFDLVTDKNEKIQGSYGGKFEDITDQNSAKRIGLPNMKIR
jgi:hypothetical protein